MYFIVCTDKRNINSNEVVHISLNSRTGFAGKPMDALLCNQKCQSTIIGGTESLPPFNIWPSHRRH